MELMSGRSRAVAAIFAAVILAAFMLLGRSEAQVTTTDVQGTVYRADGSAASGTLLVSWPSFSTALNQSVAAGSISTAIGANGYVSLALASNAGASPAGTYYTAVYHLNDGTVSREYWVVPEASTASISSVRAQLAPATVAVQSASESYVDASIAAMTGSYVPIAGGTMSGPLQLSNDPVASDQAATKHYADALAATELPLTGGSLSGTLNAPNAVNELPRVDVRYPDFGKASGCSNAADPTGLQDSTCAIQAAITWAENNKQGGTYPPVYFAPGNYTISGNVADNGSLEYYADGATLSIASGKTVSLDGYAYSGTATLSNQIATSLQPSAFGQVSTNPARVGQFGGSSTSFPPTYSSNWQFHVFNGQHARTGNGWYSESYVPHDYVMEDDQPGIDLAAPSYGTGGHSEFYPYYYSVTSRSPAFLEYGTEWQQNSISDSGQYDTGYCQGGWIDSDDEGCFHLNYNGGELRSAYTGTVTSTGTNSVKTSCTGGCPTFNSGSGTYSGGDQGDLRYLIITSSPMASGHIESTTKPSGQIPGTLTVDTTVPVSTAWGTLQANCGPASPPNPVGVTTAAVSCSVNLNGISSFGNSPGSFTTSSIVCFSGQFHECAYPTSVGTASGGVQAVNFNLLYPHNSGSVIMQGGASDTYIDLLVNRGTDNTSGTGTLKYPIDVIGSTSSNTLVDVEFWIANDGGTYSIGDNNLVGNLLLGSPSQVSSLSNTSGVVTMSLNGIQTYPSMNGQNVYIFGASDNTFNGACTNFKLSYAVYPTAVTATCNQSSSAGHTVASAQVALNCTATNASCTANQYGNGDFVLYEGSQVLDVQDPSSSPANAIDGYFLLEPNPWTWTGATVEEPHHYASQVAERKGTLMVANPLSETTGVSVRFQGTGLGTPYGDETYGAVNGHYNSSSLFTGQNANSPSLYSYFGGTMVAPNGMSLQGLLYDTLASEYAPEWGGSVLWVGGPEQQGSLGGAADPGYEYNLFYLVGNGGNNSATYFPASNTLAWSGLQEYIASNHVAFNVKDTSKGGTNVGIIFGGLSGTSTQAVPVEQDSSVGNQADLMEYYNCTNGQGCGSKDSGIAAGNVAQNGAAITPISVAVNSGHAFTRHTVITGSLSPTAVAANTCAAQSATITGLSAGDHVINRDVVPSFTAGLSLNGVIVTAANMVSMNWCNNTAAAITPPSGTYTFDVEQ